MTSSALAGSLVLGQPTVENDRYVFPVSLRGNDEEVAALNFRFNYDPAVFAPVSAEAGAAATQANKQVSGNAPEPGAFVVVMMGVNRDTVTSGTIAHVVMRRVAEPAEGATRIMLGDTTLATFEGIALPSRGDTLVVRFGEEEPAPEEQEREGEALAAPDDADPASAPGRRAPGASMPGEAPATATGAARESTDAENAAQPEDEEERQPATQGGGSPREGGAVKPLGVAEDGQALAPHGADEPESVASDETLSQNGDSAKPSGRVGEAEAPRSGANASQEHNKPVQRFMYVALIAPLVLLFMAYAVWRMRRR